MPRADQDPTRVVLRRCLAYVTDIALIVAVLLIGALVAGDVHSRKHGCPNPVPSGRQCFAYGSSALLVSNRAVVAFAVSLVVLVVVVFIVPTALVGTSPGKALVRIRVVRADGSPPGLGRSLLRAAAWVVDGLTLLLPVGLWLAMLTPGHRRVGDFVAGTFVVRRAAQGQPVRVRGWARNRRPQAST